MVIKKYILLGLISFLVFNSAVAYKEEDVKLLNSLYQPRSGFNSISILASDFTGCAFPIKTSFNRSNLLGCNFNNTVLTSSVFTGVCFAADSNDIRINTESLLKGPAERKRWIEKSLKEAEAEKNEVRIEGLKGQLQSHYAEYPHLDLKCVGYLDRLLVREKFRKPYVIMLKTLSKEFRPRFHSTTFNKAVLDMSDFSNSYCKGVDFRNASLVGCVFKGARLPHVKLDGAIFSRPVSGSDSTLIRADFRGSFNLTEKQKEYIRAGGGLVD